MRNGDNNLRGDGKMEAILDIEMWMCINCGKEEYKTNRYCRKCSTDQNNNVTPDKRYKAGDGGTEILWSDQKAGTIVEVKNDGKTVVWVQDDAKLLNKEDMKFHAGGFVGHVEYFTQKYEYTPRPDGARITFTLRKNGKFIRQGETMKNGTRLKEGRHEYYDYNF